MVLKQLQLGARSNEEKRLAKQRNPNQKAIAKGRHKHKGDNKSGKPPRYNNNNNNKNNKGRYKSSSSNNSKIIITITTIVIMTIVIIA